MQKYTEEFLDECAETLTEAKEIEANKDLMKELEPYMKDKAKTMMEIPGDMRKKFQTKLNEVAKADEESDEAEDMTVEKGKKPRIAAKD